ncbi:MAG: glycosyltransferase [Luteimonas sp.]
MSASAIDVEDGGAHAIGRDAVQGDAVHGDAVPRDAVDSVRSRVRLLLLTDTSVASAGGSERFLRNLVSLLPQDRYDITLVQLTAGDDHGALQPLFDIDRVALHKLPIGAIYGPRGWRALRALRVMAHEQRFDIVQSQHEKSDLLNALLPRVRSGIRISNRRDMGFNKSSKLKWLFRFLNHRFDSVIAPAQQILGGLARSESLEIERMLWIPNGVDTQRFHVMDAAARTQARRALGIDEDAVVFGCLASLTPVKCHQDLIVAFAEVRAQISDARLLLIGDGPLRSEVETHIATLGLQEAVALLGDRSDIESILPALDVGLLTSSTEGMSNAILEMMACGLPVIATAVGGNLQLVQPDITGFLVPPHRPKALAEAMIALAQSPVTRRQLGDAARARIEREFSLASMVHAFDQLYCRLLGHA